MVNVGMVKFWTPAIAYTEHVASIGSGRYLSLKADTEGGREGGRQGRKITWKSGVQPFDKEDSKVQSRIKGVPCLVYCAAACFVFVEKLYYFTSN